MYREHEVRRILENWDTFRAATTVKDSFLSTIDVAIAVKRLDDNDKRMVDCIIQGYTTAYMASEFNKSIRTIERNRSRLMRRIASILNGVNANHPERN